MPSSWKIAEMWPQLVILIVAAAAIPYLQAAAIAVAFILYILLSFIHKPKKA